MQIWLIGSYIFSSPAFSYTTHVSERGSEYMKPSSIYYYFCIAQSVCICVCVCFVMAIRKGNRCFSSSQGASCGGTS